MRIESGAEPVADLRVHGIGARGSGGAPPDGAARHRRTSVLFIGRQPVRGARPWSRARRKLRVKESDRIAAMSAGLERLGVIHQVLRTVCAFRVALGARRSARRDRQSRRSPRGECPLSSQSPGCQTHLDPRTWPTCHLISGLCRHGAGRRLDVADSKLAGSSSTRRSWTIAALRSGRVPSAALQQRAWGGPARQGRAIRWWRWPAGGRESI